MERNRQDSLDLLGNARDSLEHALEHLSRMGDPIRVRDRKAAILSLAHASELLLKERLARVHPAFLWEKVEQYRSLDARTTDSKTTVARLEALAGLSLSESDKRILRTCRRVRNAIEHHKYELEERKAKLIIGQTLAFILDFSARHLNTDLRVEFMNEDRWTDLLDDLAFYEEYAPRLERRLRSEDRILMPCPSCGAETIDINYQACELCG